MIPKTEWRKILLLRRKALSLHRREEASALLREKLHHSGSLLSFSPFNSEIDVQPLNVLLAAEGRLFLPHVEGSSLVPYRVCDIEKELILSASGIWEPNPLLCAKASLSEIDCILVPGLGFDRDRFRLGYGKGHYDRFLAQTDIRSIGVGFKEQRIEELLPKDSWDLPVKELLLT